MGQLVFQSTAGGQTALVSPNPIANFALNVPAVNGNLVTTGDTGTVTSTMLASNVYTTPGTIGSGTANTGAFTTLSASSTVSGIGFNNYLASPPAIGGTTANTGKFTTLTTNSNVINGATSGTLAIAATAVAGTNTATFPAATGTVMVTGNMPAFSAYASSNTTLTNSAFTKVNFQTEIFDTNNNFASSRFTPTVAGYYQLNAAVAFTGSVTSESIIAIYKNGSVYQYGLDIITASSSALYRTSGSWIVDANGTTDYFEVYVIQGSSRDATSGQTQTYFTGAMVRNS